MKEKETVLDVVPQPMSEVTIFNDNMQLAPVEQQEIALAEYSERRNCFRDWLLSQLIEGVHFGYPPGCLPNQGIDTKQWVSKPSLYKAGALFIIDLLQLRDEYCSDLDAWKMMGEQSGTLVRTCKLFKRDGGGFMGEGTGSFTVAQAMKKRMDTNGAIKMADKRAVVAAVINSIAICADLFTQDMEDRERKPHNASTITPETDEAEASPFVGLVKEWAEEVMPDGCAVTTSDIKTLRMHLKVWPDSEKRVDAETAVSWCRDNVDIIPGNKGLAFQLKSDSENDVPF